MPKYSWHRRESVSRDEHDDRKETAKRMTWRADHLSLVIFVISSAVVVAFIVARHGGAPPSGLALATLAAFVFAYTANRVHVAAGWKRVSLVMRIFAPCLLALLSLVAVGAAFSLDQGLELLRRIGEEPGRAEITFFYISLAIWSLVLWYWTRLVLLLTVDLASEPTWVETLVKAFPRALVSVTWAIASAALLYASWSYNRWHRTTAQGADLRLVAHAIAVVALGTALTLVVIYRRDIFRLGPLPPRRATLKTIGTPAQIVLAATYVFLAILVWRLDWAPLGTSRFIGPITVIFLAAACWTSVLTAIHFFGRLWHVPAVSVLVLMAALFSIFNDNHEVRSSAPLDDRPSVGEAFDSWRNSLVQSCSAHHRHPFFIVATEGGGIRAAYWTAAVLSELQRRYPFFADHTFLISGVSGGSLGATAFEANLLFPRKDGDARTMLGKDLLTPTLAVMLFPDALQQLLPAPILHDRARAIERTWSDVWTSGFAEGTKDRSDPSHLFEWTFDRMRKAAGTRRIPYLMLNATSVETGQRIIASDIDVQVGADSGPSEFGYALDAFRLLNGYTSISTAVHMSARFTYVSPAGLMHTKDDREYWPHVVDGGYFENSGSTTAANAMMAIERMWREHETELAPVVILIGHEISRRDQTPPTHSFLSEPLSPVRALMASRDAHAHDATDDLIAHSAGRFFSFNLAKLDVPAPLGWSLSPTVRKEIDDCFGDGRPTPSRVPTCAQKTAATFAALDQQIQAVAEGFNSPMQTTH